MAGVAQTLTDLQGALAARLPNRIVTDIFVNHPQRKEADLLTGVVTVLLTGIENTSEWTAHLKLKIVGQLMVPERTSKPVDIQRAEIALWQQVAAALRNLGAGLPAMSPPKAQLSRQLEFPYGWIAMDITTEEIELATGDDAIDYPPTVDIGEFKRVHVDIDLPPHASAAVHEQWVKEQPTDEQPDLTAIVELQP